MFYHQDLLIVHFFFIQARKEVRMINFQTNALIYALVFQNLLF